MQILMSFLETPPAKPGEPVWPTVDRADRDEIVKALARLIAKAVVRDEVVANAEVRDE